MYGIDYAWKHLYIIISFINTNKIYIFQYHY
jgi:hypothetical protein